MINPNLYRVYSRQGPTYEGRVYNASFARGISIAPVDGFTAHRLSQLGDFVVMPWDDAVDVGEWTCISTSPVNWSLSFVSRGSVAGEDLACSNSPVTLPVFDPDKVELPDELPPCYRKLFEIYRDRKRGKGQR